MEGVGIKHSGVQWVKFENEVKINGGCELRKIGAINKGMKGANVNSGV